MLKQFILDTDIMFNKYDMKGVVGFTNNGEFLLSCHTEDGQCLCSAKSKLPITNIKEFAIRDWKTFHTIIDSFNSKDNPGAMELKIEENEESYPFAMNFKNGRLSMTHYLQCYTFISKQQEMLDTYTHKKIKFQDVLDKNYVPDLTLDIVNTINKMSAMTNEENFKIKKINDGVYVSFGDETKTIDNAKIKIMDDGSLIDFDESSVVFNTSQFVLAYKTLEKQDIKIKFLKESIIMTGENEISKKLISLRGRKV